MLTMKELQAHTQAALAGITQAPKKDPHLERKKAQVMVRLAASTSVPWSSLAKQGFEGALAALRAEKSIVVDVHGTVTVHPH
jgi:hypothetical protein